MPNTFLRRGLLLSAACLGAGALRAGARADELALAPAATLAGSANAEALSGLTGAAFVAGAPGAEPLLVTTGADKMLHLWQWRAGKLAQSWPGLNAPARQMVAAPDGQSIAAATWAYTDGKLRDAEIRVWAVSDGHSQALPAPDAAIERIAFWPDAQTLAVLGKGAARLNPETVILLADTKSGALKKSLFGHYALAFSAPNAILLEPHSDLRAVKFLPGVALWNMTTGDLNAEQWPVTPEQLVSGALPLVSGAEFSPDAARVAILGKQYDTVKTLRMLQTAPLLPLWTLTPAAGEDQSTFLDARFAGRLLLTAEGREGVTVWDAQSGDLLAQLPPIAKILAVSPDGRWLATSPPVVKPDKTAAKTEAPANIPADVQIWDLSAFGPLSQIKAQPLAPAPDGARTISAPDLALRATYAVAFTDGGQTLVAHNGNLLLSFDVQTGARTHTRSGTGYRGALAVSPDGSWILTGSGNDNTARLWDARTLLLSRELGRHELGFNAVAFSPDSRLAMGGGDGEISIWETATGKKVGAIGGGFRQGQTLALSPDGHLLATGSYQGGIELWSLAKLLTAFAQNAKNTKPDRTIAAQNGDYGQQYRALLFSRDGKTLFGATNRGLIQAFDVAGGQLARSWETGDSASLQGLALSPDGQQLVSVSGPNPYPQTQIARRHHQNLGRPNRQVAPHAHHAWRSGLERRHRLLASGRDFGCWAGRRLDQTVAAQLISRHENSRFSQLMLGLVRPRRAPDIASNHRLDAPVCDLSGR